MNQRQRLHELYFKELLILVCQRSLHTELSISPLCIQKSSFPSPLWCYFKPLSIHPVTLLYLGGEVQIPYSFLLSLVFNLLILLISIWPRTVFLESATAQKKIVIKREKEKEIKEKESHRPPPPRPHCEWPGLETRGIGVGRLPVAPSLSFGKEERKMWFLN